MRERREATSRSSPSLVGSIRKEVSALALPAALVAFGLGEYVRQRYIVEHMGVQVSRLPTMPFMGQGTGTTTSFNPLGILSPLPFIDMGPMFTVKPGAGVGALMGQNGVKSRLVPDGSINSPLLSAIMPKRAATITKDAWSVRVLVSTQNEPQGIWITDFKDIDREKVEQRYQQLSLSVSQGTSQYQGSNSMVLEVEPVKPDKVWVASEEVDPEVLKDVMALSMTIPAVLVAYVATNPQLVDRYAHVLGSVAGGITGAVRSYTENVQNMTPKDVPFG